VRVAEYRAAMTELEDVQLEFESMKREVGVAKNIFSNAENLQQSLSSMERYLGSVLLEFEATKFSSSDAEISISMLPKLWALSAISSLSVFPSLTMKSKQCSCD